MKRRIQTGVLTGVTLCAALIYCVTAAAEEKGKGAAEPSKAKAIAASAVADTNHPEIPQGVSCNDCHEMKLDAATTATQAWLYADSPGRKAGEGVMPSEKLWEHVQKTIGGKKKDSKTFVLATSLNNVPLSTTAEFTLDPQKKVLYGFHEGGTEKLDHIRANPRVSLNWHKEFETFADYSCLQIRGRAELLDGKHPDFEKILIEFLPYEDGARVPPDATPQQREERLQQWRESLKKGSFYISRITIDQITAACLDFTKDGYRRYQRWVRQ